MFCWKLGICKSSHLSKSADWLCSREDLDLSAGYVPSPESTQEEGWVSCQCFSEHALSLGLCVCFFPISQYMQVLFKNVLIFPRDLFRLLLEALADLFYSSINNLLPQATVRLSPPGGSQEPCPLLPAPSSPGLRSQLCPLWPSELRSHRKQPGSPQTGQNIAYSLVHRRELETRPPSLQKLHFNPSGEGGETKVSKSDLARPVVFNVGLLFIGHSHLVAVDLWLIVKFRDEL